MGPQGRHARFDPQLDLVILVDHYEHRSMSTTAVPTPLIAPVRRPPGNQLPRLLSSPPASNLGAHLERFGPLRVDDVDPVTLIAETRHAGLRGRGGASFPTGVKLEAVRRAASRRTIGRPRTTVVVANGTEGEPLSRKDVTLLTFAPHLVIDGILAAAAAIGADTAELCVDRGHRDVVRALQTALHERQRAGLDPAAVRLTLRAAPSHYVTGEESALVHWLDGGDVMPTTVPPRPFERGVGGRPTLVDNVETLANLALIARYGAAWWRATGTETDPGSFLATVTDGRHRPRVYELPHGLRLGALLEHAGTSPANGVLIGGYFGTWLGPGVATSVRLDPTDLAAVDAGLGCGAIAALPADVCPLVETARVARWLAGESAGQCGPCTHGLPAIAGAVTAIARGDGGIDAERAVQRWMPMVAGRGACKLPDGAVRFVASALDVFADHLVAHRYGPCAHVGAAAVLPVPVHRDGWR
jgi:NADH:ubiquinone oxidoreductase subunit F (NADH-binding)